MVVEPKLQNMIFRAQKKKCCCWEILATYIMCVVCKVLAATIWCLIISCTYLGAAWEREKTVDGWAALLLGHIAVK